ncbi:MAG: glycerol-3-phosphate acyltransferase, partial [Anaerolineales bacterium]|nr:glycerol-3-phosphate acyltransferase [Anaerolineales bacterium]
RGSKSLSVSLGIWIGLTLWEAPSVILTTLTLTFLIQSVSGWSVMAAILATAVYLLLRGAPGQFGAILLFQTILLSWTHRADLRQPPRLRRWLMR